MMDWHDKIEQDVKGHLINLHAPLDDWDDVVKKARVTCAHDHAYHPYLIRAYLDKHREFEREAGISIHEEFYRR